MWDTFQFTWDRPCHMSTVTDTENLSTNPVVLKRSWLDIYWLFCQYLAPGIIWGLCVHLLQYTTDCGHNTVIISSQYYPLYCRIVRSATLVTGDPCDNSKIWVRAISTSQKTLESWIRWVLTSHVPRSIVILANGVMRCLRRQSNPRVSKLVKNWSVWTKKTPTTTMEMTFPSLWLMGFYGSFLKTGARKMNLTLWISYPNGWKEEK